MDYIRIMFGDKDFDDMVEHLEKTVESFFRPRPLSPMFRSCDYSWVPPMDVFEGDDMIIVRAELAGVEKEHLNVEISRKAIRISGSRKEMPRTPTGTYRLAEIQYGRFERTIYLPAPIDTDVVSSSYANGFLEVKLTKLKDDGLRRITISDE